MRAVADTSTLIDLAVPVASRSIDTTGDHDPLKVFLTVYDVFVPEEVEAEIGEVYAGAEDVIGRAAGIVLDVLHHVETRDPRGLSGTDAIEAVPGLETGEVHAVHLANHLSPPPRIFVTSEFGKNYDAILRDRLRDGVLCKSTPELLRDLGASGHVEPRFASRLLGDLANVKGWDEEFVGYLRYTLG